MAERLARLRARKRLAHRPRSPRDLIATIGGAIRQRGHELVQALAVADKQSPGPGSPRRTARQVSCAFWPIFFRSCRGGIPRALGFDISTCSPSPGLWIRAHDGHQEVRPAAVRDEGLEPLTMKSSPCGGAGGDAAQVRPRAGLGHAMAPTSRRHHSGSQRPLRVGGVVEDVAARHFVDGLANPRSRSPDLLVRRRPRGRSRRRGRRAPPGSRRRAARRRGLVRASRSTSPCSMNRSWCGSSSLAAKSHTVARDAGARRSPRNRYGVGMAERIRSLGVRPADPDIAVRDAPGRRGMRCARARGAVRHAAVRGLGGHVRRNVERSQRPGRRPAEGRFPVASGAEGPDVAAIWRLLAAEGSLRGVRPPRPRSRSAPASRRR